MLKKLDLRGKSRQELAEELPRPKMASEPPVDAVRSIIDQVRKDGDKALKELTKRFDNVDIEDFRVSQSAIDSALTGISPLLREALEEAHASILAFHSSTKPQDSRYERDGIVVRDIWKSVERVGCYVPGGLAVYPSSVLMSAVPARVAGVSSVVLCVPPDADGEVPQTVLAAAAIAQVDEVYCVGGAQAIAAMAYGTETMLPVDVIVGPGNIYVATAKREVSGVVGVPSSFAGPSEVIVVADETTPAEYAAIDLIVQAEHGPDGLSWLVAWDEETADRINDAIAALMTKAQRRTEIEATLSEGGYAVIVEGPEQAMEVVNTIAPEHLQLMTVDPEVLVPMVKNAGAIFAGLYSPASVGDYLAGPSHVLPVYGSARFASALSVYDFLRNQHVIALDEPTLAKVGPHVAAIALAEGLDCHARSVQIRTRP